VYVIAIQRYRVKLESCAVGLENVSLQVLPVTATKIACTATTKTHDSVVYLSSTLANHLLEVYLYFVIAYAYMHTLHGRHNRL